jgi:ABC-type multidrug transport system ATPase subunit
MIKQLTLEEYADKAAGTYSGGNKRKLSVGIALIGNPQIVFLDEPSTGMDPKSRRFMWDLIASTMADRAVVLTTHSMEECEALCARIAILVGGRLRCIGSAQHLKSRYGDGYQVMLKIADLKPNNDPEQKELEVVQEVFDNFSSVPLTERDSKAKDRFDNLCRFIEGTFKDAVLIETNGSLILKYRIPKARLSLSDLFRIIEENRQKFHIEAYSVSDTTLEQIFIHFARQQEEETGQIEGFPPMPRSNTGLENVVGTS